MKFHERADLMEEIAMSFAFAVGPQPLDAPPPSSRVVYRTDHLPQPCRVCLSGIVLGYSGWPHRDCMERYFRIVRLQELNARKS